MKSSCRIIASNMEGVVGGSLHFLEEICRLACYYTHTVVLIR